MPKKREDLRKHTLHLRNGDWEKLEEAHPTIPTAVVIRTIVGNYVDKIEGKGHELPNVEVAL